MENGNEFYTKDFYIACVLIASKQIKLTELKKTGSDFITFSFSDPHKLAPKIIQDHWNRANRLPSRDVIEAINELKTRIHSGI